MGQWYSRVVSALVVGVLAGGPAAVTLSDALCSDRPHEMAASHAAHGASHHDGAEAQAPATPPVPDHAAAGHEHHQSAPMASASFPTSDPGMSGSSVRECCRTSARPRVSRTAGRADPGILSSADAAVCVSMTVFDPLARAARAPLAASPPGSTPPLRPTLVLRL